MKKIYIFAATLFTGFFLIGCLNSSAARAQTEAAPNFELQDIEGNTVELSDYSGKVILLNFFATWCQPCRAELPDFNEIQEEYKEDVKIIAVHMGREGKAHLQNFASANNLDFTIVMDDGKVSKLYGPITGIPVTVIIDKKFKIAKRYIGRREKEVFVKDIEALL